MAGDGFQDNVVLRTDTVLALYGNAFMIGTDPGAKSVIFNNTDTAGHLAWQPSTSATAWIPDLGVAFTLLASGQAVQGFGVSTGGNTAGNTGTTVGTIVLVGGNQITLSQDTAAGSSATITISGRDAIFGAGVSTGGNTSGTTGTVTGTLVLAGGNNITLSQSTNATGATITISGANNNQTVVSAIGVSTGGNTSGDTGTTVGTVVFEGINNITLSQSTAAGSSATIRISGPAAIAAAAGTQTATSGTVVWSNSNNISFGMSNSSIITAIAKNTLKLFSHNADWYSNWQVQNAFLSLAKFSMPMDISATRLQMVMHFENAGGANANPNTVTYSAAIYTFSGSTLSLSQSTSFTQSWTSGGATTNSTAFQGVSGTQYRTVPWNVTLTPGDYVMGLHFRASTATGAFTIFGRQGMAIVNAQDPNQTQLYLDGISTSSFTTAMPASINLTNTNYNRSGSSALRQPGFILAGTF